MKRYAVTLGTLLSLPLAANATIWVTSGNGDSNLYEIDETGATVATVGDTGQFFTGLAYDPDGARLIGTTSPNSADPGSVYSIDPTTGVATEIGDHGIDQAVIDLTFSNDGTLYGWLEPSRDDLVTIDLTTGAATIVGDFGSSSSGRTIEFTPDGDVALFNLSDAILLDPVTGAATGSNITLNGSGNINASYRTSTGIAYAIGASGRDGPRTLNTIDFTTGEVTQLGTISVPNASGLASDFFDPELNPDDPVFAGTYSVGGTVSGLASGQSVVLQNNGSDDLTVGANGGFNFATEVDADTNYVVTVITQPASQSCAVSNGSGTATADVTDVAVSCVDLPDADNDGTPDATDEFPADPVEDVDSDGDGIGDNGDAGGTGVGVRVASAPAACEFNGAVTASATQFASAAPGEAFGTQMSFVLRNCGSSVTVEVLFDETLPRDGVPHKVSASGEWLAIPGAVVSGNSITYTLTDNGPLDDDAVLGQITDPVTVVSPRNRNPESIPTLPLGGLVLLGSLLGLLGWRKLS